MTLPNLVIAGAPKCGTSSLFRWLSDHPEVCASLEKETRYLMDESSPLRVEAHSFADAGLPGYEQLFTHCGSSGQQPRVVMEATPDYLYQETAREVLSGLRPQPHIVFLLRKPSARVYSHYQFARNNMALLPREVSFERFVEAARRNDDPLLAGRGNLRNVLRNGRYADYIERWLPVFDRDRVHVHLLETMRRDARAFMATISTEIGIAASFYDQYPFPKSNESVELRSLWLQRLRRFGGRRLRSGRLKAALRSTYERLNVRGLTQRPGLDEQEVLRSLDAEYEPSVNRLARLLNLDLSSWA